MNDIIIIILLILNIFSLIIGYILGKINSSSGVYIDSKDPVGFFNKVKNDTVKKISIDDSIFISDIKTDSLEKKYDKLGETKTSNENISSSISKLKSIKG